MFPTSSQELPWSLYNNRRLLMHTESTSPSSSPQANPTPNNSFDANVVMVLSVLLCALVCSLGLNSIVRCALRCSAFTSRSSSRGQSENEDQQASGALSANIGIKKAALKMFPTVTYSDELKIVGLDTECVICLSEFASGERVRLLPKCGHGFHVRCIDKWLSSHSSCPTCRHCLIETCQKIVGIAQASSAPEAIINMVPLAREDMVHR